MEIRFLINEQSVNSMTWEDFEMFERSQEGSVKLYELRPILARFLLNGDGFMEHKEAMKVLGKVPVGKIRETVELFINTLKEGTVPKVNGDSLKSPSEVQVAASESPVGSVP